MDEYHAQTTQSSMVALIAFSFTVGSDFCTGDSKQAPEARGFLGYVHVSVEVFRRRLKNAHL
jgi:hypothetical protein